VNVTVMVQSQPAQRLVPQVDFSLKSPAAPCNTCHPVGLQNQLAVFKHSFPGRPLSSVGFAEDQRPPERASRAPAGVMI
jgi:hypothetical protein